ncbi:MAG: PaaX family transcriptional regulator C-terminal domain-containing protein [Dermatophilaceae bacterium]
MATRHSMEDPRLLLSLPFRAVHFVFGLTWPDVQPLPGTALVTSLETLGMSRSAARGLLLRLRRAGAFVSSRRGRRAMYELTPASRRLLDEISRRATEDPPPWDGSFRAALVTVPESARGYREVLRRRAVYAGFGILRPGLLIAPYETSRAALESVLAQAPQGTRVLWAELRLSTTDAREAARQVWSLDVLGAALRHQAERMSAATAEQLAAPPSGPAAMAALWEAIGPFFEALSGQPLLPRELLPQDWAMVGARGAFQELAVVAATAARSYLDSLMR